MGSVGSMGAMFQDMRDGTHLAQKGMQDGQLREGANWSARSQNLSRQILPRLVRVGAMDRLFANVWWRNAQSESSLRGWNCRTWRMSRTEIWQVGMCDKRMCDEIAQRRISLFGKQWSYPLFAHAVLVELFRAELYRLPQFFPCHSQHSAFALESVITGVGAKVGRVLGPCRPRTPAQNLTRIRQSRVLASFWPGREIQGKRSRRKYCMGLFGSRVALFRICLPLVCRVLLLWRKQSDAKSTRRWTRRTFDAIVVALVGSCRLRHRQRVDSQ